MNNTLNSNDIISVDSINRHRINTDGMGVRTVVFVYGCPLSCKYCINPSTWKYKNNISNYMPKELFDIVKIDNIYFQATSGGITFSGGEPLLYPKFINEFISICPDEWNFVVETSLNVPNENILICEKKISQFIVDIKTLDREIYHEYTGKDLDQAFDNLQHLLKKYPHKVLVRIPMIPNITTSHDQDSYEVILRQLGAINIEKFVYKSYCSSIIL